MAPDPAEGSTYLQQEEPCAQTLARTLASEEDGAVCTFLGTARRPSEGKEVDALSYEAYPAMAEKVIGQILAEVPERFPAARALARHRLGPCALGEASVAVAAVAPHRKEAFAACRYVIDEIKARAPIWKQEVYADGTAWVGEPS